MQQPHPPHTPSTGHQDTDTSLPNSTSTSATNSPTRRLLTTYEYHDVTTIELEMFYHPRTISILIALIAGFIYVAFWLPTDNIEFNLKIGLSCAIVVCLIFGVLEFRDGPFIRPHPAFWRLVLAFGVVYQLILTFILFQSKHDVRQWLTYLDPSLGVPLPERSYAEHCDLSYESIVGQLDIFVLAHVLGWFGKALILRDYWFCWILSIMFEVMEYSLQHQLPNFAECWWDHWVLDVLICNWLGIYLGMKTCEYFEMKQYSWRGIRQIPTYSGKIKRTVAQFTPHSWTKFEWGFTKKFKNFVAVLAMIYLVLQVELNAFYLKYLLWIPPENKINTYRLTLFFFLCLPATREAYQFLTDPKCYRFGMHAWMTVANILTELLICIKFGKGEFPAPHPTNVIVFWCCLIGVTVLYAIWQFVWEPYVHRKKERSGGKVDDISNGAVTFAKQEVGTSLNKKQTKNKKKSSRDNQTWDMEGSSTSEEETDNMALSERIAQVKLAKKLATSSPRRGYSAASSQEEEDGDGNGNADGVKKRTRRTRVNA